MWHRESIFSSHTAALGSNLGSADILFSLVLSLGTELRSNPFSSKQWISQTQLVVMSRSKYCKYIIDVGAHLGCF